MKNFLRKIKLFVTILEFIITNLLIFVILLPVLILILIDSKLRTNESQKIFLSFYTKRNLFSLNHSILTNELKIKKKLQSHFVLIKLPISLFFLIARRVYNFPSSIKLIYSCKWFLEHFLVVSSFTKKNHEKFLININNTKNKKILVLEENIPNSYNSAGEKVILGVLQDLVFFGFDVYFLPRIKYRTSESSNELKSTGVTILNDRNLIFSFILKNNIFFDVYYFCRAGIAEEFMNLIKKKFPASTLIYHAHDLNYLREGRSAKIEQSPFLYWLSNKSKKREIDIIRCSNYTFVVSPIEKKLIKKDIPESKVFLFRALYIDIQKVNASFKGRRNIFFLGGFQHFPNIDAVHWFVNQIWPRVIKKLPDLEFHIIGSAMPQNVKNLNKFPGVITIGFVKELEEALKEYRLAVLPLRFGAGIKGKLATSMSLGIPSICTSVAAEGMEIKKSMGFSIENSPIHFANAIVQSYVNENSWNKLSVKSIRLAKNLFSREANRSQLHGIFKEIGLI